MRLLGLALVALTLAGCARKNIEDKDSVKQAVLEYLTSKQAETGLNLGTMDLDVPSMTFEKDTAQVTVSFKVKGTDAGMQLNYNLDRKGDKWVVRARQDFGDNPHGGVIPGPGGTDPSGVTPDGAVKLPPGHPSVNPSEHSGAVPDGATLPPGHPTVGSK